ncbi:CG15695, partial [Drosophila busckii]
IYFVHEWIVPRHIMGVIVECHLHKNISNVIQRDAFSFVQYPEYRNEENDAKRAQSQPSVILIGIDSMSRVNFQRTMPLTAKFVRQTGWYEMLGYNKVGDNTLPNLLALLTGSSLRQVADFCNIKKTGCLDALTYLWNHYKNAGYLTAYAEDISAISTFNYLLPGFVRQPVDYYLRPFLQATEQTMKTVKHFGNSYCVGRKPSFRYVFDFCQQMIQRFITETPKPLFGLFWTNSFSHDDFSGPASVDKHFVKYLNDFKQLGLFEKAIVILFSDHGQRQGQLMEFPTSFLEERLPMLYIHLPAWFHQKYPKASKALEKNQRRLCSTFDLHLTLKDVLLTSNTRLTFPSASPCMGTSSLFYELPKERRCGEACIAEHWCTCESYVQVSVEGLEHLGSIIVYRINQVLSKSNVKGLCHRLKLGKVLRIEHKQHFDESGNKIQSSTDTFRLKFTTLPNGGLFRATIECDQSETVVDIQEDFITRLNSYGNESYCVSENALKRFCVC